MDNRIKVGIRVRPLSQTEQSQSGDNAPVFCDQSNKKLLIGLDSRSRSSFAFDWCYPPISESMSIYREMCLPLVNKVFEGYHATFFAYGQTGSGKTFTMGNSPDSSDGIIQYTVQDIFEKRKIYQQEGKQVTIEVSYMEIYMEECYDLLSTLGEKKKVDVRENSRGETYVENLTQRLVHSPADFASCISHACRVRSVSKTAMNSHSSRSHAICTLTVRVVTDDDTVVAKLNLVDLAGSERAKKTMATGDTLQEGININKGLLALGNVVSALSNKSKQNETKQSATATGKPGGNSSSSHIHVPYRESKLTRLLKDSLGGNGMTALLACVSPAQTNYDETLNTLRFASRASSIVNVAKVNHEEKTDAHVLNQEVNRLRAQLATLQEKFDDLQQSKSLPVASDSRSSSRGSSSSRLDSSLTDMLSGSSRLTSCFKSLVMHCFMDDIPIDDEVLQKLKEDISTSAGLFGCEIVEEEENKLSESILEDCEISGLMDLDGLDGFNCVPPIAKVLDRLTNLETHLKKNLNRAIQPSAGVKFSGMNQEERDEKTGNSNIDSNNDLMLSDIMGESELSINEELSLDVSGELALSPIPKSAAASSTIASSFAEMKRSADMAVDEKDDRVPGNDGSNGGGDMDDSFERQVVQLDQMQTKFVKLTNLGHHYEHMIRKLNQEINVLQNENTRLTVSETAASTISADTAGAASSKQTNEPMSDKVKQDLRQKSKELEEKIKVLRKKEMEMQKILSTKDRLAKELDQKQEQIQTYKKDKVKMMKKMQEKEVAHRVETKVLVKNDIQARQRAVRAEANAAKLSRDLSSREKFWQSKLDSKKMEMERLKTLLQKREEVKKMRNANGNASQRTMGVAADDAKRQLGSALAWKNQDWKKKLQEIIAVESKMAKCNGAMQFHLQKKRSLQQDRIAVKQKMRKLRQSSPVYKELEEECKILDTGINTASQTIAQWQMRLNELEGSLSSIPTGATTGTSASNAKLMSFKDFTQALLSSSSNVATASDGKEEWKSCLQTIWEQFRQSMQSLHQVQSEVRDLQMQDFDGMDDLDELNLNNEQNRSQTSLSSKARRENKRGMNDEDEDEDDDDTGSGLDDTFYPSEDDDAGDGSDFDDDASSDDDYGGRRGGQKRQRGGAKKQSSAIAKKPVSRKRTTKRTFDEVNDNSQDHRDGDAMDSDAEDNGSDTDDGDDFVTAKAAKRARITKFSFVSTESADSEDHTLLYFIRNNVVQIEDILDNATYFTLAVSLYDMIPNQFVIAKRELVSETDTTSIVVPSMDFKKAFTAADNWKQQFPLRTIKQREEAWMKLKNTLALFFSACVVVVNPTDSADGFVKSTMENDSNLAAMVQHGDIVVSLQHLKLKEAVPPPAIVAKKATSQATADVQSPLDPTLLAVEEEKWNKYTIKDLKPFLSERGLPVSGTKKELVTRLSTFEVRNQQSAQAIANVEDIEDKLDFSGDDNGDNKMMVDEDIHVDEHEKEGGINMDEEVNQENIASVVNPSVIASSSSLPPLRDRTNYLKSLSELTSSAATFATNAAANTVQISAANGISKRSFRLNLDELTEELENRPAPGASSVISYE